nr:UvrD-helicase domain-containing protein [Micromonospora tarapacensis]
MLVLGGPGTGKTRTLVEAVAARVAEGVDPERILVLTFSRRGAADLRHRVEARIAATGQRVLREPLVRTFPAYAFGLLRRAAAERGEPSPRLLTGPEQDLIIRELLDVVGAESGEEPGDDPVGWPVELRPALRTRAFAAQLRDLLMRAAERGVGPVELARLGERLGRADWPAAARFLREYVAVLALRDVANRGSVAYDPAELVRAATGMLRDDAELLSAERRRLAYVYVDELADTDPAQLDLLDTVAGGGIPLVAFADPDSSTYAFRGADPAGVTTFPHRFRTASGAPAAQVLLSTSYRAGAGCWPPPPGWPGGCAARRHIGGCARCRTHPRERWRYARSPRPPARRPGWRTRCVRRTCSMDCPGRGWRCWSAPPPGSCPGCAGRCTRPAYPPWCTVRISPCTCNRRSRRCCSCCAVRWSRSGSTRRPPSHCCTRRSAAPTRWPSGGCGRACGHWLSPAATGGPPAS